MKKLNKLFSLGIVGLSATPMISAIGNGTVSSTISSSSIKNNQVENDIEQHMRCTVAYVGKKCAKDGLAIIARTNDASPNARQTYLKKVKHNELANKTIKNDFGFEYTMPSTTYEYISCPDQVKSNPKDEKRFLWESMGINEMGVGVTCTLTCFANPKALEVDPFVESGIAEEAFNQILASQADSARKAMEIAAATIDKYGSQDANLIMATDQNETWLMELYTGHEYCAVKLPDDKVMVAGNEFILDSLFDLGITELNKENCIVSPRLLSLAKDNGFAVFKPGATDLYHLDLFNTYSEEGPIQKFKDGCHMRTWRGFSLWDPTNEETKVYSNTKKYPALFVPKDKEGNVRKDLTIYDVMYLYRDEYDDILNDGTNPNYAYFKKAKDAGTLRAIATESAGNVHVLTSNPNLPKEIAANAMYCPSNANYGPFILLNNGINKFEDEPYTFKSERYEYDERSVSDLYRKISTLAWGQRVKYGYPLQELWGSYEYIYITQMLQVIEDANKLSSMDKTRDVITNFNKELRTKYVDALKNVGEDLLWHDMNQHHTHEKRIKPFDPLIDMQEYLTQLGWTDFNLNGNTITFKYGDSNGKLIIDDGYTYEKSKLIIDGAENEINIKYKNNKAYVSIKTLNYAIGDRWNIVKINVNDYLTKNQLPLILSLSIGIPLAVALAITIPVVIHQKKKHKKQAKAK